MAHTILIPDAGLDSLATRWLDAKQAEEDARERRVAIELLMTAAARFSKAEGSQTIPTEHYRVEFSQPINRSVDPGAWEAVRDEIPPRLWPIKYKPEVVLAAWRDPALAPYRELLSGVISERMGKIGVSVKAASLPEESVS